MATATTPPVTTNVPRAGRPAATSVGAVLAALALTALLGAAVLGLVHASKPDEHGFYTSGVGTVATPTHALVSDGLDIEDGGGEAFVREGGLGTIRVTAAPANGKPVFVGIARTAQVDAYLAGVARDDVTDLEVDPLSIETSRRAGRSAPAAPADQSFWSKSSTGSGTRTIEWPVKSGEWDVVVMNADGTPGLRTEVSVGARLPLIGWIAGGLLVLGTLLGMGAAALLVAGRRNR